MENTKKDKTIILWRDTRFLIGILLLIGVFLVGMETLKMIKARINHHVRKTYHYTKGLPKKGYHYTKKLISKND